MPTQTNQTGVKKAPKSAQQIADEKKARRQLRTELRKVDGPLDRLHGAKKPLSEWDEEELARGRPRDRRGGFAGSQSQYVTRAAHEEAIRRFTDLTQSNMRALIPKALAMVEIILDCNDVDARGKPVIPYGVKLDAAKWTIEHLVGKPTQRVEADISVRLQGILAGVMINPGEEPSTPILAEQRGIHAGSRPSLDDED